MSLTKNSNTGYLHNLCSRGAVKEITKYLKESLSSANQLEERVGFLGYTPLHEATHRGHVSVVRLLLLYGANPNTTANGFYTCLHMAASMDNVECVKELIKHGANIESQDEFGKTPYETAVIHRCKHTAKLLKSAEIKKMAKDNDPRLKETLKNLKPEDISPTCLQEALEIACQRAHVNAINYIILADDKETLKLRDSILITLKFHYVQALSVLLVCYASQEGYIEMLGYLLGRPQEQKEKDTALMQLPHSEACHPLINDIRNYLKDKEIFNVAVPIKIATHKKHKSCTKILLLCTNCNKNNKQIDWRKLGLREIDSSLFKDIRWAEKVFLVHNMLTTIPSNITDLHRLCRLDLQNNQLHRIPSGLLKMNCLRTLNLSKNKLTELPKKCNWSPSLNNLDLSDNVLDSLPKNMGKAKLSTLYIARNNFYNVPACVCEILTLERLDLSGNRNLRELPKEMGRLTEIFSLKLDDLDQFQLDLIKVTDPPDEIKKNGTKTIMYLRAKLRSSKGYYSLKLMLVGRAAQGKTTLMHRLQLDFDYNSNKSTNGISMEEFRLRKDLFHKEYMFKVWDFGGQEDYYATHQCFLSTLSLYILVWNLEEGEDGIAKLEGWLDTISARAPRCSAFIIVGTHLDKIRKDKIKYGENYIRRMHEMVLELLRQQKYDKIDFKGIKEVSCAVDSREGIEDLRMTLYDAASSMLKPSRQDTLPVMGELIPHSYFMIEELIQIKRQELKALDKLPIILRAEFEALVTDTVRKDSDDEEDPNDIKDVTNFLNERGIIMHYDDPNQDLQDYYFLEPSWLCDLMARVVTVQEVNPLIVNGILHRDKFQFIFKDERFPYDNYPQFVRLLNRFQIVCSLDENRLLVPSKLPEEKPEEVVDIPLPFVTIKRKHSLPFIPFGFWDRFIARFLYYTEDMLTSGCSSELGPGSPKGLENISPFLLDSVCCKCPLVTKNGEWLTTLLSQEDVSDEEEVVDEVDNNGKFGLGGVYINGDDEERQGGVFINGQWFGNAVSGNKSDSYVDYSTDEDVSSSYGYGSQSGHYTPRVIRCRDAVYGRNVVKEYPHRKKTKRSAKKSQEPLSQSFDEAAFKSPKHHTKSNSLPSSFPSHSGEDKSDGEQGVQSSPSFGESSMTGTNGGMMGSFDDQSIVSETSEDPGQSPNIPTQGSSGSSFSSRSSSGFKEERQAKYDESFLPDTDDPAESFENSDFFHGSVSSDRFNPEVEQPSCPTDVNGQLAENGDLPNYIHSSSGVNQESEQVNKDTPKMFKESPFRTQHQPLLQEENHQNNSSVDLTSSNPLLPNIERYLKIDSTVESSVPSSYPTSQQTENDTDVGNNIMTRSSNDVESSSNDEGRRRSESEGGFKLSQPTNFKKDELSIKQDHGIKRQSRGSHFFQDLAHCETCPLHYETPFDQQPDVPTDLRTLIDNKFLHCWRTGICLHHPKLFFSVSTKPDPNVKGRSLIETEASPSRVGRRVLNYIVDHIDTLTREWYPDLAVSDGMGPNVRQFIPCVVCERLGLRPYDFTLVDCQIQSGKSDAIPCPNHSEFDLNLHLVCPDIMLQDVDPELLLSKEEIMYNESESNLLGEGGFGKVFRGKCRNQSVAIKFFISIQNDTIDPLKHYFEARKELKVLRRVRQHPYLISIVGVCLRPLCLVLELAEKGSLQASLFSSLVIHRVVLFRIAYQVADAISYLHSLGIIYRDLKPENVLVWSLDERDDLHVKLIDFGTANFATYTGLISVNGSLATKAPEMLDLRKEGYTMQVDVYSYAILLYQMILRQHPFIEITSEASVNAAVTRGDRPRWKDSPITSYGFPSLVELMLQCWVSKPTRRPRAEHIAQQVRMPPFQALLGKQPIPSEQSVRHACVVPDTKELWLGCYDHSCNKILIFDCKNLNLKHTFSVDRYQDHPCAFQVQALHHVGDLMLIAFRGLSVNILNAYSISPHYKLAWSIHLNEQATCIASDESYVYVGMNEGYVQCICKKDFKKHERKRNDHMFKVEHHCVLSMVATSKKLWISSSKYICTYFTTTDEMEAFDMESMWYGGPLGMEMKPQTQVYSLTLSFDRQSVWSACRSVLTKWSVEKRQTLSTVDCAPVVQAISNSSFFRESDACIVCILPVLDTIWLGTAGGYILIFSSEDLRFLTWFHPFEEVRTLSYCVGPGPCRTEQCFVISTGKNVRAEGFETSKPMVCPLTPERLREVHDEISYKMASKEESTKSRRRSTGSRSTFYQPTGIESPLMFKCSMLVWEAFPANVFERIEAKSGRCPIVIRQEWQAEIPSDG